MTKTTTVHGLRDGRYTAGTGLLVRKIKAHAAKVTVAATGRVTVIDKSGERHVYALVLDLAFVDTSPLRQALTDLERAARTNLTAGPSSEDCCAPAPTSDAGPQARSRNVEPLPRK